MDAQVSKPHDWKEWRRMRAWRLKQQGWRQRDIAEAFGVSDAAVSQWVAAAERDGPQALLARGSPGHPAKLSPEQCRLIPDFLWHGAEAYGFRGEVWTCARVAKVIEEEFHVSVHKDHVGRLLKQLGWTPQVPITRAIQRDEKEIALWRTVVWPQLRRWAARTRRTVVFVDEAGFYLLPGLVRTYGPKGETPILDEWQTRDHLSVMGGLTPNGRVYVLVRPVPLTGLHTVVFLKHLVRHVGPRLLVIWDRSPIHRRLVVKQFVDDQAGQTIWVELLPAYAPELNPLDQGGWNHLKHVELRNLPCLDLDELHLELHLAIGRLRQKPHLIQSFFKAADLL
jgi:transposase